MSETLTRKKNGHCLLILPDASMGKEVFERTKEKCADIDSDIAAK